MLFKILGSGTGVPSLKRHSPANYLRIGDKQILIDCGTGTLHQLEKARLSFKYIDIVCLTHFHTDHISDLDALVHALSYTPDFIRKKDLILIGPEGFRVFFRKRLLPTMTREHPFKLIVEEKRKIVYKDFTIESFPTPHTDNSAAFKFSDGNKEVVITGDTDYSEELAKFASGADVLVTECSFPNERKKKGHLVPMEAAMIAKNARVGRLVLTHLYPIDKEVRLKQARDIFRKTFLARDMMTIKL